MQWNLNDPLEKAIFDICEDLRIEHDWGVTDDYGPGSPMPDETLPSVIRRFISPLLSHSELKQARIAALKAELKELENDDHAE